MKTILLLLVQFICVLYSFSFAQTYTTIASGSWSVATNWQSGSIPPNPLPVGRFIVVNHNMTIGANLDINGKMTISAAASLNITGGNKLSVGPGVNASSGEVVNNGVLTVKDIDVKPGNCSASTGYFPVLYNNKTLNISGTLRVGDNSGCGSIFNSSPGKINVLDVHLDYYMCSNDTMYCTGSFLNHGGIIECCGTIITNDIESKSNSGRPGIIRCHNLCGPTGSTPTSFKSNGTNHTTMTAAYNFGLTSSEAKYDDDSTLVCGVNSSGNTIVLPVELIYFKVDKNDNGQAVIEWSTASETNNNFFTLERSLDGIVWNELIHIKGRGNSSRKETYAWLDSVPIFGINYYRLSQTDYNGRVNLLSVKSFVFEIREINKVVVLPNPTKDYITVISDQIEQSEVALFNLQGRKLVMTVKSEDKNHIKLDLSNYASGYYILRVGEKNIMILKK